MDGAEPDHRLGGLLDAHAEGAGEVAGEGRPDRIERDACPHGGEPGRIEAAEHQVGVGDGEAGAAAAIADRAGLGAGALGPDLEHPGPVDGGDRAPAGADGVDVDHRQVDRQPVIDREFGRDLRHAAGDQRHVGRRPSHVVRDGVGEPRLGEGGGGRHHARGRARHHGLRRRLDDEPRRHGAAIAVHHQQVTGKALGAQIVLKAADVAVEDRLHGRVDRGGGATLVFAELGEKGVAEGDIRIRPDRAGDGAGAQLVLRVGVGVEEVDHQGLAALLQQGAHRLGHRRFVEGRAHRAVGHDALRHLAAPFARDQRLEGAEQAIGLRSRAAPEFEDVAKPLRGDEADLGGLALQHRVGGGGGAVDDEVEVGRRHPGGGNRRQHALGLVADCGRHLGEAHADAGRIRLRQEKVGEGAADIDACHASHVTPRSFAYERLDGARTPRSVCLSCPPFRARNGVSGMKAWALTPSGTLPAPSRPPPKPPSCPRSGWRPSRSRRPGPRPRRRSSNFARRAEPRCPRASS